jgi:uncharacterized protein YndB with AHSA1/START domain
MKQPPRYSLAERDRRRAVALAIMDDEDADALAVYGEHELAGPAPFAPDVYFTNDMIELDYRMGYAYPPAMVFRALTEVADYPQWQSDVLAARVSGGGPTRSVLGNRTYLELTVEAYEPDRTLALRAATGARPAPGFAFRLEPVGGGECCQLGILATLDGVPALAVALAEAMLTYQTMQSFESLRSYLAARPCLSGVEHGAGKELGVANGPGLRVRDLLRPGPVVQPEQAGQRDGRDQRVGEVFG